MCPAKIPSKEFDVLREHILKQKDKKVEVLVDGRHGERPISVCLASSHGISGLTAAALSEAVKWHFLGRSERVRLRTQFFLLAYHDIPGIFLKYELVDHLLEMERATLEVPQQIMRLVNYLEEEQEADVEFRFGHDPVFPFKFSEFVLSKRVEIAGSGMISQCSQKAQPSLDFILEVGGEYLKRIVQDHPPTGHGCAYVVDFVLEEENGVIYFRMYNNEQRFFSVEKDKLRGEKS